MFLQSKYPVMHVVDPDRRGLAGDGYLEMTRRGYLFRRQVQLGRNHLYTGRCRLGGFLRMLILHMIMFAHFILSQDGRASYAKTIFKPIKLD